MTTLSLSPGGENLTLSEAELDQCRPRRMGGRIRALCPFHGSDKQRSLSIDPDNGRFQCFACGVWGYTQDARDRWREEHRRDAGQGRRQRRSSPSPARPAPVRPPQPPRPARDDLAELLKGCRAALPGSLGEEYLRRRRIPIELAQRYGVGYAASGTWPGRGWKWGRVVFAHTDPDNVVINLYGRAVESDETAPKGLRHDHLPGAKAYFNAQVLRGSGPLFIVEGAFDALALIAAGHERTVAIFGVNGWRWEWARAVDELIVAFDADALDPTKPAHDGWQGLVRGALMRGKTVRYLPAEAFGGAGDISAAWAAGVLNVELQPDGFDEDMEGQGAPTPDRTPVFDRDAAVDLEDARPEPQLSGDPLDPLQYWP
ncbi:MAG: CHC2 zinc finger domain-containing protein [Gammaproteobacteria bacterium]|nr:CHC2 zinc finger domain-containing protein [Gammaproteobacteria bacterium]